MRGLDRLADAASLLDPAWALVAMGDGPLAAPLLATKRIHLIPPAPHAALAQWTCGAALGAVLYEDLGLNQHYCSPNKLWEYAAAGVPALASDLPEIARVVRGYGTGLLIDPAAGPHEIAAAVNALGPDDLVRYGASARRFAETETWSQEVAPLLALANRLLSRESPR